MPLKEQHPHSCKPPFIFIGSFMFTSAALEELVLSDNEGPACHCFDCGDLKLNWLSLKFPSIIKCVLLIVSAAGCLTFTVHGASAEFVFTFIG